MKHYGQEFGNTPDGPQKYVVNGYYGLGDAVYMRPFVKELCRRYRDVSVITPFPEIFCDCPGLRFVKPKTHLRSQRRNIERYPESFWETLKPPFVTVPLMYDKAYFEGRTMIEDMERTLPLGRRIDFRWEVPPAWRQTARARLPHTRRQLCLVRWPTVRDEWFVPARNPTPEAMLAAFELLRDRYYTVSIADLHEGERFTFDPPPTDFEFHHGELSTSELVGLAAESAFVLTTPGFMIPLCVALETPCLAVFGGYHAPQYLVDDRLNLRRYAFVAPEPFCHCMRPMHECRKEIPCERVQRTLLRLLARVAPKPEARPPAVHVQRPPLFVDPMIGMGDTLIQRDFVRLLSERWNAPIYVQTPWPDLYTWSGDNLAEHPVRFVQPPNMQYRTQQRNMRGLPRSLWHPKPALTTNLKLNRNGFWARKSTFVEEYFRVIDHGLGFKLTRDEYNFALPVAPVVRHAGRGLLSGIPRPVALVHPPKLRSEWLCPARNPNVRAFQAMISALKSKGFHTVLVADVEPDKEWIVGPSTEGAEVPPEGGLSDPAYTDGGYSDLDYVLTNCVPFPDIIGLFAEADLVATCVGFAQLLSLAVGTRCLTIYGGHLADRHIVDPLIRKHAPYVALEPDPMHDCHDNFCPRCSAPGANNIPSEWVYAAVDAITGEQPEVPLFKHHGFWAHCRQPVQDYVVIRSVYEQDEYGIACLNDEIPPKITLLDVGAHIGCFAAKWHDLRPDTRIVCVEANPQNLPALKRNILDFADVVFAALTYEPEVVLLDAFTNDCESTGGSAVLPPNEADAKAPEIGQGRYRRGPRVPTVTIEDVMRRHGLDRLDFIKMDCEGSEFSILNNMTRDAIERTGVIFGEYHGPEHELEKIVRERFKGWHLDLRDNHRYRGCPMGFFVLSSPSAEKWMLRLS